MIINFKARARSRSSYWNRGAIALCLVSVIRLVGRTLGAYQKVGSGYSTRPDGTSGRQRAAATLLNLTDGIDVAFRHRWEW